MEASALKNISISPCPRTGVARVIDQLSFKWDDEYLQLQQKFRVFYVDTEGERISESRMKPYEVIVHASNNWLVDPTTGEVLMEQKDYDALLDLKSSYDELVILKNAYDAAVITKSAQDARLAADPELIEEPIVVPSPVTLTEPVTLPSPFMGEYDFFLLYGESPIELYPLLLSKALGADAKKRFD